MIALASPNPAYGTVTQKATYTRGLNRKTLQTAAKNQIVFAHKLYLIVTRIPAVFPSLITLMT